MIRCVTDEFFFFFFLLDARNKAYLVIVQDKRIILFLSLDDDMQL